MPDTFDPYREALVMETRTIWPEELKRSPETMQRVATALHAAPDQAGHLEYARTHSGFCRQITVTEADLQRLQA